MQITENITGIIGEVYPGDILFYLISFLLFGTWLYRTSFGTKALDDSRLRRNSMPAFLPLVLIFTILLSIGMLRFLFEWISVDLAEWQKVLIVELLNIIAGLVSIGFILYIIKVYFVRGIKGFGLNIKTIPKDFVIALLYLLVILPIMNLLLSAILFFNEKIIGPEYEIPTHVELQSLSENTNIMVRIAIAIGTICIVPLLEELLFRGLFQTMIRSAIYFNKHAAWVAILITSVFFTMSHENPSHWPVLFVLGVSMGYSYEKSGSLFRPVFIHMLFNSSAIVLTWLQ